MSLSRPVPEAVRLRAEQVRLIYGMAGMTIIPATLVAIILAFVLNAECPGGVLFVWAAAIAACKVFEFFDARHALAHDDIELRTDFHVRKLMVVHGIDAAAWAALVWLALHIDTSPPKAILIVSVTSGVIGGALSLLSPVVSIFVVYAAVDLALVVPRFLALRDPAYSALALIVVPYIVSIGLQAKSASDATARAIKLRFENLDLTNRLRGEIARANVAEQEAVDANRAKTRFLAAASHDLRQPIHALGLFLEVLQRSGLRVDQQRALSNARRAADASASMLNALLDFSRSEAGVLVPQMKAFNLQDKLMLLEAELAAQAEGKGLYYRSRETDVLVHSDPTMIDQILRNLVSNAIRYTAQGGVLVAVRRRGDLVRVEVWDSGMGIPTDKYDTIFEEFQQLGNPERDRRKGLGLGLAIASRLAETLDVKLTLCSRVGRGSVFRLELPRVDFLPEATIEPVGSEQPLPEPREAAVLIIDDDEAIRVGMTALLDSWGFRAVAAEDYAEARSLALSATPDILVCDFRLRGGDKGPDVIARLRRDVNRALPALLITGDTDRERLREAAASQLHFLHKPVAPDLLRDAISKLLVESRAGRPDLPG